MTIQEGLRELRNEREQFNRTIAEILRQAAELEPEHLETYLRFTRQLLIQPTSTKQ